MNFNAMKSEFGSSKLRVLNVHLRIMFSFNQMTFATDAVGTKVRKQQGKTFYCLEFDMNFCCWLFFPFIRVNVLIFSMGNGPMESENITNKQRMRKKCKTSYRNDSVELCNYHFISKVKYEMMCTRQ